MSFFWSALFAVIDYWIPSDHHQNPIQLRQSRLLVGLILLICSPLPIFMPIHVMTGQYVVLALTLLMVVSFGSMLVYIRRTGNSHMVTQLLLVIGLVGVVVTALQANGIHSVVASYLVVMPIIAFVMLSRRWGALWAIGSAGSIGAMLLIELLGWLPAPTVNEQDLPVAISLNLLTLLVFVLGTFLFLDEINQLQRTELVNQRRRAEQANNIKSAFLANMSHELRTPLNGVLGLTEALLAERNLSADQASTLETILRSGRGLSQLLDDLLDFSKLEAERLELESLPIFFPSLVDEVFALLQERARQHNVTLQNIPGELVGWGEGDLARLRQILLNLVGNAVKFTQHQTVTVQSRRDGDVLHVSVIDHGIGIAEDKLAMLFEPFIQADPSTTRRFGGSGLGLSICRRLVRLMNGDITVSSTLGEGSTFSFWVPFPQCCPPTLAATFSPQQSLPAQLRVLVAEDNPINQEVIRRFLTPFIAVVSIVENGQVALETVNTVQPDVVLMDIQMPVLDGLSATRTLRNQGFTFPIVALTASALPADQQAARDAGMNAFLSKPINRQTLYETLHDVLSADDRS